MIARLVRVHGLVQGVAFRASCQWEAQARGVAGWARNEADGTVTARFEGSQEAVEAMVEWCRTGPRAAKVTDVEVEDVAPEGTSGFSVG